MLRPLFISVVIVILVCYAENTSASPKCWKTGVIKYGCWEVDKFSVLDKAPATVRSIWFHTCSFTNVPGNVFYRFRAKLKSIDMHLAGIQSIDSQAFRGLTNLVNLTLWGNSLDAVYAVWFSNLTNLRTLDLSFNRISYIEETVFQLIPNLENLYIDSNNMVALNWNVFSYTVNLRRVKLGKNPWNWWYRAQITRELANLHVDYNSEWDDYNWINHVVWNCMEKDGAKYEDDSVLDCASANLLQERSKIVSNVQTVSQCGSESRALYDCASRSDPLQNVTITPKIAVRKILQASSYHRSIVTRIVGGKPTTILKYPFMVSLQKKAFGHVCGGTYLRGTHVLSAAHCFVAYGEGNSRVQNPLLFIAIAGATDVTLLYVPNMQIRLVLHIVVHPRYDSASRFNDIALIRLDRSFTSAQEVIPVPFPPINYGVDDIRLPKNGSGTTLFCQTIGWGYLLEKSPLGHGKSLMVAKVPLLNNANCSNWYSQNEKLHYSEDFQICAGLHEGGVDACQGDSGGPLICNGLQIGIVSTGEGCGRRERPGLYTRLDIYLNWIEKVVHLNEKSVSSVLSLGLINYSLIFCTFTSLLSTKINYL